MTVTQVHKDPQSLTMRMTAEFDAPIERVWQLVANPRLLERWWGPPTYPATFVDHDLSPGARITYFMTGPEGEEPHAGWRVIGVDPPRSLDFEDGFADEDFEADPDMPVTRMNIALTSLEGGRTALDMLSTFESAEEMEKLVDMGMEEGMREAMGQMDA